MLINLSHHMVTTLKGDIAIEELCFVDPPSNHILFTNKAITKSILFHSHHLVHIHVENLVD